MHSLLKMLDDIIQNYQIPTQSAITHVTNTIQAIEMGAPVDLVFQSIGGTEGTNQGFGINLSMLEEAKQAAPFLNVERLTKCDVFGDRPRFGTLSQCVS